MVKPVQFERKFKNVYVCMSCGAKIKAKDPKKTVCRRCGSKDLRLKAKERRGGK